MTDTAILSVRNLSVSTATRSLVRDLNFTLVAGRTLALIGESGSGKSMTALAIMGLLPNGITVAPESRLAFAGTPLPFTNARAMRTIRGRKMAIVFQDPMACLNPFMRIGTQIDETLVRLGISDRTARQKRILSLMAEVELPEPAIMAQRYPHELSGGQQQRIMIAMALAGEPDLLIADEPTSALDASVEGEIVNLLADLQARRNMAMLFITHDLSVASVLAHEIAVMRNGEIVEKGYARHLLDAPRHPYSIELIGARKTLGAASKSAGPAGSGTSVLTVENVSIDYAPRGLFGRPFRAVHDATFALQAGKTLGILGESGSGKSTMGTAIAGLTSIAEGRMIILGQDVVAGKGRPPRVIGSECQLVFQNTFSALNPRLSIAKLMTEPLALAGVPSQERTNQIAAALREVGLEPWHITHYPHQLSGGQRQRVCIARALLCRPRLLICDEIVSALDMTVQVQVLELLKRLQAAHGFGMVFIGHDIEVVRWVSDDIIVMKNGRIVDQFERDQLDGPMRHDFTKRLLKSHAKRVVA